MHTRRLLTDDGKQVIVRVISFSKSLMKILDACLTDIDVVVNFCIEFFICMFFVSVFVTTASFVCKFCVCRVHNKRWSFAEKLHNIKWQIFCMLSLSHNFHSYMYYIYNIIFLHRRAVRFVVYMCVG